SCAAPGSRPPRSSARRRAGRPGGPASRPGRERCSGPAACRRSARRRSRAASSVALIALLSPWIAIVVVAVGLPEAGLVLLTQLEPAHPFRALPEVQVRDEQACGSAVLGLERLAVVGEGDPRLAAGHVLHWQVGRVPAV